MIHSGLPAASENPMPAIATLLVLFSSMFHTAPLPHEPAVQPDSQLDTLSERVPSRSEINQIRSGAIYSGSGCISCSRTSVNYSER
jgi:hypothetical protein